MPDRDYENPEFWDAVAREYEDYGERITTPYGLDALDALEVEPGMRLLDVAAGTGALARAAAARGAAVTAVDSSAAMVARLAARAAAEGLAGLDARVMDGAALDLPDGSFDRVASVFGVILFADHRAGLAEIRRVLRPGGAAAVVGWSSPDRMGHLRPWWDAIRAVAPGFDAFDRPAGWLAMQTPEGMAAELERAGLRDVAVRPLRHALAVPSIDWLLARHADRLPFFGRLHDKVGPGAGDAVRARMREVLRAEHGDGPFALPSEAWLAVGRR